MFSRAFPVALVAVGALRLRRRGYDVHCDKSEHPLTDAEFKERLKKALVPIRRDMRRRGMSTPPMSFRKLGDDDVYALELRGGYCSGVAPMWTRVVLGFKNGTEMDKVTKANIKVEGDGSFSIINTDKSSSLTVRAGKDGHATVYKNGGFIAEDISALIAGYKQAFESIDSGVESPNWPSFSRGLGVHSIDGSISGDVGGKRGDKDPVAALEALGVRVYGDDDEANQLNWNSLAGFEEVKSVIDDTIISPMKHPDTYDAVARKTRERYESNRPKAVLFEGPPGTGKTLCARIIADQCGTRLVHVPIESVVSKWYGESEKKLAQILEAADRLDGTIIFVDEVDALATSRDNGGSGSMHEASRRMLSVLLQRLEGMEGRSPSLLICATNRKHDLDAALLSRFDVSVPFPLPDANTRAAVFKCYARHLSRSDLELLAGEAVDFSCRDIKESCLDAERKWASRKVKGEITLSDSPDIGQYNASVVYRRTNKIVQKDDGLHGV